MFYRDGQEVAVTYFRAGYSPNDYPSDKVRLVFTNGIMGLEKMGAA